MSFATWPTGQHMTLSGGTVCSYLPFGDETDHSVDRVVE